VKRARMGSILETTGLLSPGTEQNDVAEQKRLKGQPE